jgi:hypothetical protein
VALVGASVLSSIPPGAVTKPRRASQLNRVRFARNGKWHQEYGHVGWLVFKSVVGRANWYLVYLCSSIYPVSSVI